MKRWLDDPDEREGAALLAPLAAERPVDAAAKARIWDAVGRRVAAPAVRMRRAGTGILVAAVVIAGAAAGRELLRDEPPPPARPEPPPEVRPTRAETPPFDTAVVIAPARSEQPTEIPEQAVAKRARVEEQPRMPRRTSRAEQVAPTDAPEPAPPEPEPAAPAAPDAELVAYREARAAMRGDLREGLARMTAFAAAYPDGRFDAEARLSIIECKVRLGRLADVAPDVAAFLARFPASERTGEVRFIRAEIQRQVHGRCDRALPDYRAAAASPRVADDARFFRGWCADQIGDLAERDDALRAYLAAAPAGRHAAAARALLDRTEPRRVP